MAITPVSRCTRTKRSESASESAIGISIITCLPASMHCTPCAACICVGVLKITGIKAGQRQALRQIPGAVRNLPLHCDFAADSALEPTRETTSMPGIFGHGFEMLDAERTRTGKTTLSSDSPVFQDHEASRGVRCRHVIVPINLGSIGIEGAAQ